MSDNAKFVPTPAHSLSAPDTEVNARDVFGIDIDMRKKKSDLINQLQNLEHNK